MNRISLSWLNVFFYLGLLGLSTNARAAITFSDASSQAGFSGNHISYVPFQRSQFLAVFMIRLGNS
jgi:hypothetical protein